MLTIAEQLRRHGVVGKFVEFYGPGVAAVPLENRATIGNMSPEYGSTITIFPIDDETLRYLRFTGRTEERVALVEAYAKAQGLWHDPARRTGVLRAPRARPRHRSSPASRARPGPTTGSRSATQAGRTGPRCPHSSPMPPGSPGDPKFTGFIDRGVGRVVPGQRPAEPSPATRIRHAPTPAADPTHDGDTDLRTRWP